MRSLIVAALVMLAAGVVDADAPAAGGPKATFVKGDVQSSVDGKTWTRLKRGSDVAPGSHVKTGADSRAELTFTDKSVVRVGPTSELKVDTAAFEGKSNEVKVEATLVAGEAWAKVAKLASDQSKFQVKTANAVAGVRGTVFRVNIDRDEATVVKVYNGAVAVAAPLIASEQLVADNGSPIRTDRKEVKPPMAEVTKAQFEVLLGKMMQVRIAKDRAATDAAPVPTQFTDDDDKKGEPEWVRWNSERDSNKSTEKSD
jgi:hypothetical protein